MVARLTPSQRKRARARACLRAVLYQSLKRTGAKHIDYDAKSTRTRACSAARTRREKKKQKQQRVTHIPHTQTLAHGLSTTHFALTIMLLRRAI